MTALTIWAVKKDIKRKKKFFSENPGHNISRFSDVLPKFIFTTSETKCDYY